MIKGLINFFSIVIFGLIQVSFMTTWPYPVNVLNLLLSVVIFLAVIVNYQRSLWWAFGGGLVLDFFSATPFGLITLAMILTVVLINFLFNNFFTNRSFYSLALLGGIGVVSYNLIIIFGGWLLNFLGLGLTIQINSLYFYNLIWHLVLNFLILLIIFLIFNFSTGRLRANFLIQQ